MLVVVVLATVNVVTAAVDVVTDETPPDGTPEVVAPTLPPSPQPAATRSAKIKPKQAGLAPAPPAIIAPSQAPQTGPAVWIRQQAYARPVVSAVPRLASTPADPVFSFAPARVVSDHHGGGTNPA